MDKTLEKDFVKLDGSITVKTAVDEVKAIADKNIKNSAYYNVLVTEAIWQFLNDNDFVNCEAHNLRASSRFLSEFEVTDIQLPNLSIYVRAVYDEDLLFIPKKHFQNKITPDVYLFVKIDEKLESGEVLGYVYPEQVNKKNDNGQYYFVNKSFLKPFSELLTLIKTKEIKEQYLITDKAEDTLEKFIMLYIDHDIDNLKFEKLVEYLKNSSVAREKLIEFENFEKLSYMAFKEFENLDVENNDFTKYIRSLVSVDEFSNFNVDDMQAVKEDMPQASGLFIDDDLIVQDESQPSDVEIGETEALTEDIPQIDEVPVAEEDMISEEIEISDVTEEEKEPEFKDEFDIFDNPDDDGFDSEDLLLNPETEDTVSDDEQISLEEDDTLIPADEDIISDTEDEQIDLSVASDEVGISDDELTVVEESISEVSDDELLPSDDEVQTDDVVQLSDDEDLIIDSPEIEISDEVKDEIVPEIADDAPVTDDISLSEDTLVTDDTVQLADDEELIIDTPEIEISDEVKDEIVPEITDETSITDDVAPLADDENIVLDDISLDMGSEEDKQEDAPVIDDNLISEENEEITAVAPEMNIDEAMSGQTFEDEELSDLDFVSDEQIDNAIGDANMEIEEPTVAFVTDEDEKPVAVDDEPVMITDEDVADTPVDNSDVVLEDDEDTVISPVPEQEDETISDIDDILADITGGYSDTDISEIAASMGKSSGVDLSDIYSNDSDNSLTDAIAASVAPDAGMENAADASNIPERDFSFAISQGGGMNKKLVAGVASGILILCIAGIGAWFMLSHNGKSSVVDNTPVDNSGNTTVPDVSFDNTVTEPNLNTGNDIGDIQTDLQIPAQPVKLDDDSQKSPQLTIQKIKKDFSQPDSYLSVSKIIWDVPEYMTYNDEFSTYLQTVGNSLKVNISSDLLLISENPVLNTIKMKIGLKNNGTTLTTDVVQGCGIKTIDDLVLQSVKKTMNILKPPASGLETADEDLYLTICL